MLLNVCIFLIAAIFAFMVFSYSYILYYRQKADASWLQLKKLFETKFSLCSKLFDILADIDNHDNELTKSLSKNISKYIEAKTSSEFSAADKRLTVTVIRIEKSVQRYPLRYITTNYEHLSRSIISLEEKIGFARQFHNDAADDFNNHVFKFPIRVVAAIFNVNHRVHL
ncbi:hypothetical protein FACS1894188_12030 [Clostridia bacterium]|nr:hypothetical protein FACS1894188_12030 [Clostridia bacterium]